MLVPAVPVAGAVFAIETSALAAVIVVVADAVLLPGFGSASFAVTVAVFVIGGPPAGAVTTMSTGTLAPEASVPRSQVTTPPACEQEPLGVTETKVVPAGSVSVSVTFVAGDGPAFAATRWYVMLPPARTPAGPDFVTETSALGATAVVVAVVVLFAAFGSNSV